METQLRTHLSEDLYAACRNGDLDKALALSSPTASPKFHNGRPLSAIITIAADGDHAHILESCLSEGDYVDNAVMLYILTNRAIKTH